jgi:hypothetical protein
MGSPLCLLDISGCAKSRFRPLYWVIPIDPQITHKLSRDKQYKIVNKLCISFMLLGCNDKNMAILGLFGSGFLPTMKFQLSQLP